MYYKYSEWISLWREYVAEEPETPKAPKIIGCKYNRHNSLTPPLDFRLNPGISV